MKQVIKKENFVKEFVDNFVPDTSRKRLKQLHCYAPNHGYLWMVCEHNLVKNLKGNAAMVAYNNADKKEAIEIQYDNGFFGDDFSQSLSKENDTAEKIKKSGLYEFYVIGKDFSWCYIVTHEPDGCGPYFIINEKNK